MSGSGSRRNGPGLTVPPTLLFVAGFAVTLGVDAWMPWPINGPDSKWVLIGLVLIAFGVTLFAAGLMTFARAKTGIMLQQPATRLVTHGPYRWSRNPQYLSFVAVYAGATLVANSYWPWIALPVVIVALNAFVIAREERYMATVFARDYESYCRQAPRWI